MATGSDNSFVSFLLEGERPREPHGECAEKPPPYGFFLRPKENRE
jgi:hypothetical protein